MEDLEVGVNLEGFLHHFETVFEGDVEGSPHLFGDFAGGALAGFDLLVEDFTALRTAAVVIEQDVSGILHENCAVEICRKWSA